MTFTLIINPNGAKPLRSSEHDNLRDARAALIRHQARRGLSLTINRWFERAGHALQDGHLRQGQDIVGDWSISYPLENGAELPPYAVERLPL